MTQGLVKQDLLHNKNSVNKIVICGGVAANRYIFSQLDEWAQNNSLKIITPPLALCTDNAAMIAWAGVEKMKLGLTDSLDFKPRARWEISEYSEKTLI